MSETPKPDEAPKDPARRKARPRNKKVTPSRPPVDAYKSVSLLCGRTRYFDTEEGGRLRVDPGEVALSFRLRRNVHVGEGEPIDTATCLTRLADDAGELWETEAHFSLDVFIQNMVNLDRMSWLVYFDDAEEEWKKAFEDDCLMTGATCLRDDRFYRNFLVGEDQRVEFQFKYQCPQFDVAFYRDSYLKDSTRLIVRVSGLYDAEGNDIRPLAFEMNWWDLLFRNELYFDTDEGQWTGDGWPLPMTFRKVGATGSPQSLVRHEPGPAAPGAVAS
jgi:hypothetical protein